MNTDKYNTELNNYDTDPIISYGIIYYDRCKQNQIKFNLKNPEKSGQYCKTYIDKLKSDPITKALMLEKRKKYYNDVVRPKKQITKKSKFIWSS